MNSRAQYILAVGFSIVTMTGTRARIIDAFDLSEIPYASSAMPLAFPDLPAVRHAWLNDRDPLQLVITDHRWLCTLTVSNTLRCWSGPSDSEMSLERLLSTTPWVRRDVLWHSLKSRRMAFFVHSRETHALELVWPRAEGGFASSVEFTADSVFALGRHVCGRSNAHVICLGESPRQKFSLASPTAEIVAVDPGAFCARVEDRIDCQPFREGSLMVLRDEAPQNEPAPTGPQLCTGGVFHQPIREERAPMRFSLPWLPAEQRKSMIPVMRDPQSPSQLSWRSVEASWPYTATPTTRCLDDFAMNEAGGFSAENGNALGTRFKPSMRSMLGLTRSFASTPSDQADAIDQQLIDEANHRTLRQRMEDTFVLPNEEDEVEQRRRRSQL